MGESLGDIKITASTDKEAAALVKMLQGRGMSGVQQLMGQGKNGKQQYMVAAKGNNSQIASAANQARTVAPGQAMMTRNMMDGVVGTGGVFDRLKKTFTQKNMKELNKSLFMMQMASLGVAFSFMSIINSVLGLFSGLSDLGTMISTGALGTAFAGIATGGANTTDIAGTMGVTTEMQTAAWAGFTAIVSQITALFNALAVKVLSPEMVGAILTVVDALAEQLAKPEVTKAIQEIVLAVLDIALNIIPLLPLIASLIVFLGESGLLKVMLMIILAAEILLPTLAYVQFIFYAVEGAIALVAVAAGILGISFAAVLIIVGVVILIIDVIVRTFQNLADGMSLGDAILTAFGQTFADVMNVIIGVINFFSNMLGAGSIFSLWSTSNGTAAEAQRTQNTTNNITFSKSVSVRDRKAVSQTAMQIGNATMG